MSIEALEKRLGDVLTEAVESADPRLDAVAIARQVYLSNSDLMDELKEPWLVEKLAWYVRRKRGERWRDQWPQLVLPGFEDMPRRIFLRNGQRPRLEYATAPQIEDHVKLLRSRLRDSPKVKKMEAVLQLVRRYADDEPGITWGDVKRKELERRDFERLVGP